MTFDLFKILIKAKNGIELYTITVWVVAMVPAEILRTGIFESTISILHKMEIALHRIDYAQVRLISAQVNRFTQFMGLDWYNEQVVHGHFARCGANFPKSNCGQSIRGSSVFS